MKQILVNIFDLNKGPKYIALLKYIFLYVTPSMGSAAFAVFLLFGELSKPSEHIDGVDGWLCIGTCANILYAERKERKDELIAKRFVDEDGNIYCAGIECNILEALIDN